MEAEQSETYAALLAREVWEPDLRSWLSRTRYREHWREEEWVDLVAPVLQSVRGMEWLSESDRASLDPCILDFLGAAFTIHWPRNWWFIRPSGALEEGRKEFTPWAGSIPDRVLVRFCWTLLAYRADRRPDPVSWLRNSGRLAGEISWESLNLAVALAAEAKAMHSWPQARWAPVQWESAAQPYRDLMDHESYLVRANAAKALGAVYKGLHLQVEPRRTPPLAEILAWLQEREAVTAGVAAGFLDGSGLGMPFDWQEVEGISDIWPWMVETLRRSAREPSVPGCLRLEFLVHEYFCGDAGAIRQFLAMGRREVAVITATERTECIPELMPVLEEMMASSDPQVAAAIRTYLAKPGHHVGTEHLPDCFL